MFVLVLLVLVLFMLVLLKNSMLFVYFECFFSEIVFMLHVGVGVFCY